MSSQMAETLRGKAAGTPRLVDEVAAEPGCDNIISCVQCGTCSSVCPSSPFMDYTPREIIGMVRAGREREVLKSRAIWYCASCYSCAAECPQQIKVTQVMYALRRKAIAADTYPKGWLAPMLVRQFHEVVRSRGRNSEARVMLRTYLRCKPWKHIGKIGLAARLWIKGRMTFKPDAIRSGDDLKRLLRASHENAKRAATGGTR